LKTALGFLSGNYILAAAKEAFGRPQRRADCAHLQDVQKAYDWARAHDAQWAEVVARDIGVPLAYVQDQFAHRSAHFEIRPVTDQAIASQQSVADVFVQAKLIPRAVDVKPLWDDRFNATIAKGA
jgi:sulfonate transport system substrate-binding protein